MSGPGLDPSPFRTPVIRIVVDDRERNSATVEFLQKIEGVELLFRRLSLGDYELTGQLLVERKTLRDFVSSIKDGRLFRQACRLASSPMRTLLILEGTAADLAGCGMRREAMQGALITLSLVLGIPVLRARDPGECAQLMLFAGRQIESLVKGAVPRKGKRPRGKRRTQLEILQALPGIGPERAARLLETFGNIEGVIQATLDQLLEVEGIGPVTAKSIRWAVSEEPEDYHGLG